MCKATGPGRESSPQKLLVKDAEVAEKSGHTLVRTSRRDDKKEGTLGWGCHSMGEHMYQRGSGLNPTQLKKERRGCGGVGEGTEKGRKEAIYMGPWICSEFLIYIL